MWALVLWGCGSTAESPADGRDTLVVALPADLSGLDPITSISALDFQLLGNLFPGLTDARFDCRLGFAPDLAASWETSPDGRDVTFHLRHDRKWSDGEPVTAKDVAFTYELVADPKVASPRVNLVDRMRPEARAQAIDDWTVRFGFVAPGDPVQMLADAAMMVVPQHALGAVDRSLFRGQAGKGDVPTGGPWRVARWDRGQQIVLEPNPYWPEATGLRRVILKVIPEYASRLLELENGSVDATNLQDPSDVDRLRAKRPDLALCSMGKRYVDLVAWNDRDPRFSSPAARRALTLAIDRDKLATEARGEVARSPFPPILCDVDPKLPPVPYDPAEARAMLATEGWVDRNGDGWLDRDGVPFRVDLLISNDNARRERASVRVQADLKAVGVDVRIEKLETHALLDRMRQHDFEAALTTWTSGLRIDPRNYFLSKDADEQRGANVVGYESAVADDLIAKGMAEPDPAKAAAIWADLARVLVDDQSHTWLYWFDQYTAIDGRFEDVGCDVVAPWHHLERWRVPAGKTKYER